VLVADRGLCAYAHLALLAQAGRQLVDFTPGRSFVRQRVRRTSAVKGFTRSRGLKTAGFHDQLVVWCTPKT
jgi:hypothetical protein